MTSEPQRLRAFALLAAAAALAGCLTPAEPLPPSLSDALPTFDGVYTWRPPVAHLGDGSWVEAPDATDPGFPRFVETLTPDRGAEPTIGMTSSGAVFVVTFDHVLRSRDRGATWEPVFDFVSPNQPVTADQYSTGDPLLWVDATTDRIYVSHLYPPIVSTYLYWSDDEGETWTERPFASPTPYIDHQKVMTAPRDAASATALGQSPLYPNVLYMCYNKLEFGTYCAVSHDGGLTWPLDNQVAPLNKLCGAINGHPAAFADGAVVVPFGGFGGGNSCTRGFNVAVTEDEGVTWTEHQCAPEYGQAEIDPDVTVTPDGTAYMLFRHTGDQLAYLARSTDRFATCDVFRVAPPDHTMNVFTGITSGDDGRLAMAYLGTRDPQALHAIPSDAQQGSRWHLFVTTTENANAEQPVFVTQQVTPEEDPVQLGCVWLSGGGGGPYRCRNLLDFIDLHHDGDGRPYVAFTDGCTPRRGCTGTPDLAGFQSRDSEVAVLVQVSGAPLFAESGLLEAVALTHPLPPPP